MKPTKTNLFNHALYVMRENYASYPVTMGACCVESCGKMARGSGKCPDCCEEEIAELIGDEALAAEIHSHTKIVNIAISEARGILEGL